MIARGDLPAVPTVGRTIPARGVEPATDVRQQEFTRSLSALVGKTMQATVLSRMTDGSYLVQVAGATARMALPANPQPGAEVPLTLVSLTPRPTFAIGGQDGPMRSFAAAHGDAATALPGAARDLAGAGQAASQAGARAATAQAGLQATPPSAAQNAAQSAAAMAAARTLLPQAGAQAAGQGQLGGARAPGTGSLQHAAALLGKAPLGPSTPMSPKEAYDNAPQLSQSARMISHVLSSALKSDNPPTVVAARVPVVAGPVIEPAKLASALKEAIGASGLFYESHVAEWTAGERPLTALMREPQNQGERVPRPAGEARQGQAQVQGADGGALREAATADPHRLRPLAFEAGTPERAAAAPDQATAQFINLQLSSQEQGRVAWQGQLWPGQELAWQISRDAPEGGQPRGGDGAPEPAWRSGLRFRFPLLGEIAATVVMHGDQLHIQIQAGSDDIGGLLRGRAGDLASALEAAGTPLASLTVADRAPPAASAAAAAAPGKDGDD